MADTIFKRDVCEDVLYDTDHLKRLFQQQCKIVIKPIHQKTVCSYHVTCTFQGESTLYSCLNVNELLAQSKCKIWSCGFDFSCSHLNFSARDFQNSPLHEKLAYFYVTITGNFGTQRMAFFQYYFFENFVSV